MRLSSLFFGAVSLVAGCGGDCPPAVYGGTASDEAWTSLRDALDRAELDDTKAPLLSTPKNQEKFSGPPTRFSWTSPLSALPWVPTKSRFSLWSLIVSDAHAHLPPVTGEVFLLEVGRLEEACPYRVLTTEKEFSTDDALKERLQKGGEFKMKLTSVYLTENRVTDGPYQRIAVPTFTVNP